MIADDRGSEIAKSSAIVCDHMETHFCDRLRWSCDRDHRRSQTSSAIVCDQLRLCHHMETMGAFHYAKQTGQRSVGIPEENGTTFPIKSGQPIEMALVILNSFTEFPN